MGGNDVPTPPSEADSQQSADEGSPEPEPEKAEDDDDDDDVFQGEFSRKEKKKPCATEGGLEGVATNAKALLDKFEAGLTATFPKELSQPFGSTVLFSHARPPCVFLFL